MAAALGALQNGEKTKANLPLNEIFKSQQERMIESELNWSSLGWKASCCCCWKKKTPCAQIRWETSSSAKRNSSVSGIRKTTSRSVFVLVPVLKSARLRKHESSGYHGSYMRVSSLRDLLERLQWCGACDTDATDKHSPRSTSGQAEKHQRVMLEGTCDTWVHREGA